MNGGFRVAQVLQNHNVQHIFTLCGGHISPILVESKKRGIQIIDVRHEANAAFAADASSRMTGGVGVVAVTAGPGVTNTITAVKNAQLAQSPLLLIGGATATMLRGRGSLQDIDQIKLIKPHVKWYARPNRLRDVVPALEEAFVQAQTGVPGPVFVEIAVDLLYDESIVRDWYKAKTDKKNPKLQERIVATYINWHLYRVFGGPSSPQFHQPRNIKVPMVDGSTINKATSLLSASSKAVLVIGSQAFLDPKQQEGFRQAIEKIGVPVFLSGMGRGFLGVDHELQMRHKRTQALKTADLVFLCGVPCDFRLDYGSPLRRAKVISINRSRFDVQHNISPELAIVADPSLFVQEMAQKYHGSKQQEWILECRQRHDKREVEIQNMAKQETEDGYINPLFFFQQLDSILDDKSILVGDGGDFVATCAYVVQPRGPYTWLDPGVFGTLGVGAGFAMGAKCSKPDHDVFVIYGDGACGFSIMELDSCVRNNIPIIAIVGNDAGWTQIARDQVVILEDDVATTLTYMDYHTVAEGCGAIGLLLKNKEDIVPTIQNAIHLSRQGKTVLINVLIGKTDFRKGSISM